MMMATNINAKYQFNQSVYKMLYTKFKQFQQIQFDPLHSNTFV
jgi:hypothetical protein